MSSWHSWWHSVLNSGTSDVEIRLHPHSWKRVLSNVAHEGSVTFQPPTCSTFTPKIVLSRNVRNCHISRERSSRRLCFDWHTSNWRLVVFTTRTHTHMHTHAARDTFTPLDRLRWQQIGWHVCTRTLREPSLRLERFTMSVRSAPLSLYHDFKLGDRAARVQPPKGHILYSLELRQSISEATQSRSRHYNETSSSRKHDTG